MLTFHIICERRSLLGNADLFRRLQILVERSIVGLAKECREFVESLYRAFAEFAQRIAHFGNGLAACDSGFAVKFIGIANHLFLNADREHVAKWQIQMLVDDVLLCDARTGMAFAHQRMSGQTEAFKYLTPDNAMLDIRIFAAAVYAWRVGAENANVVQHRCLKGEFNIHLSPVGLVALTQLPGEQSHLRGVLHKQFVIGVARLVVFRDY